MRSLGRARREPLGGGGLYLGGGGERREEACVHVCVLTF